MAPADAAGDAEAQQGSASKRRYSGGRTARVVPASTVDVAGAGGQQARAGDSDDGIEHDESAAAMAKEANLKQRLLQAFAKSLERAGVSMASLGDLEQTTQTIRDVARILRGGAPTGPHPQVEALREDLRKARAAGGGPDGRGTAGD